MAANFGFHGLCDVIQFHVFVFAFRLTCALWTRGNAGSFLKVASKMINFSLVSLVSLYFLFFAFFLFFWVFSVCLQRTGTMQREREFFDVCIVGAGPHGLAVLSALLNPDATLTETDIRRLGTAHRKHLRVCVVDKHGGWMHEWKRRFSSLDITMLRSPTLAHPDAFSAESLLEFAIQENRLAELQSLKLECSSVKGLAQLGEGMFEIPSNNLFLDFCSKLIAGLEHQFICGELEAIVPLSKKRSLVRLTGGKDIVAKAVVMSVGIVGKMSIPQGFQQLWHCQRMEEPCDPEEHTCSSSKSESEFCPSQLQHLNEWMFNFNCPRQTVLIVGGGLSAVQAALLAVKLGHDVTLCSRSKLRTRFFDLPLEWMDWRKNKRMHFDILSCPSLSERVKKMQKLRSGGSVPPSYLAEIERAEAGGRLTCIVDECSEATFEEGLVVVKLLRSERLLRVKTVLLATSIVPDFGRFERQLAAFGLPKLVNGFPILTQDLAIEFSRKDLPPIFVVGHMSALQLGPDASNLSGGRRSAQIVASALGLHDHRISIDNTFDQLLEVEA